jgi:hypothetical protein
MEFYTGPLHACHDIANVPDSCTELLDFIFFVIGALPGLLLRGGGGVHFSGLFQIFRAVSNTATNK